MRLATAAPATTRAWMRRWSGWLCRTDFNDRGPYNDLVGNQAGLLPGQGDCGGEHRKGSHVVRSICSESMA